MNVMTWLRSEWDRVAGFTLAAVGGVLVVVGGIAAKGAPTTIDSLSYIATAGLIGLCCVGFGIGLFLSADLHDEWHKLDRIEAAIRGEPLADAKEVLDLVRQTGSTEGTPSGSRLVSAAEPAGRGGQRGLTAAVALNPGAARLLPAILLAPLAVMAVGVSRATRSEQFTASGRGVWTAVLGLAVALTLVGLNTGRLRARVTRRKAEMLDPYLAAETARLQPGTTPGPAPTGVWVVDGLRHFHRSGCPALAGLEATAMARDTLGPELVPCGLCGVGG